MQKLIQIQQAIKAARGNGKYRVDNDVLFSAIDEVLDYIEDLRDEVDSQEGMCDICEGNGVEYKPEDDVEDYSEEGCICPECQRQGKIDEAVYNLFCAVGEDIGAMHEAIDDYFTN